ncbi:MAG: hypothetical protein JWM57_3430 [Phycisphaerales bacterium]|nr:hypothetical protein [Phycisphaerales bacterium]
MHEEPRDLTAPPSRYITWRSIGLGLLLALGIAVLTPYNDYVINNSFLVGSYFPPIVTLAMFAVVLLVNGPLYKFAPRFALAPGELAVALAMGLIACSIPSQGLFRQLIPLPVAPFYFTDKADYHELFKAMKLPNWLWAVSNPDTGSRDRAFTAFYARLLPGEKLPWGAWVRPLLGWGSFAAMFFTAMFSLACILRFQWTVNERLAFPIAQLQSMLIAPPRKGRAFNDLFSSRPFWIGLVLVFVVQSSSVLNLYFPSTIPAIPYSYDLKKVLADQPWTDLSDALKANTIYFTLLGLAFFTPTKVSFSLWGTAVGVALLRWTFDPSKSIVSDAAMIDQALGASFAFMFGVLWIGRHHWMVILRALFGASRPGDARGAFVSYRLAAIAFIVGVGGMTIWLLVVGCSFWLAAGIVLMILMAHVITARVVAETGLAFLRVAIPFDTMLKALPATLITPKEAFLYGVSHYTYMQSARESQLVFAIHALNVVDSAEDTPGTRRATMPVLIGTLVVTFFACAAASLWCYYGYASPLFDDSTSGLLNQYGLSTWPKAFLVDFPQNVERGFHTARPYSVWYQLLIGIGVMTFLQAMTWRFAAWPLLPVGYLMCSSWYVAGVWFSLFLGWLSKVVILRFGGASLYNNLKPFFVGLIFGEALAVGFWLIVTFVLALSGQSFFVVRFMPQ